MMQHQLSKAATEKLVEALSFAAREVAGKTDAHAVIIDIRAGFDAVAALAGIHLAIVTAGGHAPGIQGRPKDLAAELLRQANQKKQEGS